MAHICLLMLCHAPQQFVAGPHLEAQDGACCQPHCRRTRVPVELQADLQAGAMSRIEYCPALACMMRAEGMQTPAGLKQPSCTPTPTCSRRASWLAGDRCRASEYLGHRPRLRCAQLSCGRSGRWQACDRDTSLCALSCRSTHCSCLSHMQFIRNLPQQCSHSNHE